MVEGTIVPFELIIFRRFTSNLYRYLAGAASSYNGEDLIRQSNRGIVVVVIQYRLGVFGELGGEFPFEF